MRLLRASLPSFVLACLALAPTAHAQAPLGAVHGHVIDAGSRAPLENASVVLRSRSDSTRVLGTATDSTGAFAFTQVPLGLWVAECSLLGHLSARSAPFVLSAANPRATLKPVALRSSALMLDEVVISTERSLFHNSIDRRVYNVDHDLLARSSTASDVLQNLPSVQVDVDGNVSLRGSPDVLILVNGKKSPLMGASRADVLQQLPAAGIEKIEVITNPSARFTPEGTSGIINIVMKKNAGATASGDATVHAGESGRHNENVSFGGHPGHFDLFGSYGYRDDRRHRTGSDARTFAGSAPATYREDNTVAMRPLVHVANAAATWHASAQDQLELTGDFFQRHPSRDALSTIVTHDAAGGVLTDHDRVQTGEELDRESSATAAFQHDFAGEDHQLRIESGWADSPQREPAHFVDRWRVPVQPDQVSDVTLRQSEQQGHVTADYAGPLGENAKLETGVALERHQQDIHSDADTLDPAQAVLRGDPSRTYRFRLTQTIEAAYGTYQRALGSFGVMGGLRAEYAVIASDLVTGATGFTDRYTGLYPTLHLSWRTAKRGEWQLSYSRRIRRPESDDLNPFPEFTDPYNMDSGNPRLRPESIHSLELGWRLRGERFSLQPALYVRYKTDGFTRITRALTDTTFLRTMANLASDRSAGFEPVATFSLGRLLQANVNANVFYEQIDASNLGYAGTRSVVSWSGTGNATLTPRPGTQLELNASYRSARLTPQGDARPSFGLNVGARQGVWGDRLALTLAISDVLKTQRQETELDVAGIRQHVVTHRDARVVYAGLTAHYGRAEKKDREKAIQYEDPQ